MWVSGGSRIPDPGEHDVPKLATTVAERIVRAGHWISRCSGKQEWVKRDWEDLQRHAVRMGRDPKTMVFGHCNFTHLVETAKHERAVEASRAPFVRTMGTHRSWEHLQECYMVGSIDRINARIADLASCGTGIHGARPGQRRSWTDRPHRQPRHARLRVSSPAGGRAAAPVKAVIFDMGGILEAAVRRPPLRRARANARGAGAAPPASTRRRRDRAHRSPETLREFYATVARERRQPVDADAAVARHLAVYQAATVPLDAGVLALIEALRRRHVVACLTNTEVEVGRFNRARGLYRAFDRAFLSTELGLHKPDRAIFDRVLAELGCAPGGGRLHRRQARERGRRANGPACTRSSIAISRASGRSWRRLVGRWRLTGGAKYVGAEVKRREDPRLLTGRSALRRRPPAGRLPPRGDPPEPARSRRGSARIQAGPAHARTRASSAASRTPTSNRCSGRSRSPARRPRRSRPAWGSA